MRDEGNTNTGSLPSMRVGAVVVCIPPPPLHTADVTQLQGEINSLAPGDMEINSKV